MPFSSSSLSIRCAAWLNESRPNGGRGLSQWSSCCRVPETTTRGILSKLLGPGRWGRHHRCLHMCFLPSRWLDTRGITSHTPLPANLTVSEKCCYHLLVSTHSFCPVLVLTSFELPRGNNYSHYIASVPGLLIRDLGPVNALFVLEWLVHVHLHILKLRQGALALALWMKLGEVPHYDALARTLLSVCYNYRIMLMPYFILLTCNRVIYH